MTVPTGVPATVPTTVRRVEHAGIMVADIDAAVQWYTESLGFEIVDRWADAEAGMSWAHLRAAGFRIEFVQRPGLSASASPATGIHHLALVVDDCEAATARLVAAGAEQVFAPAYFERHDMDWSFVRDPFGNILELVAYRTAPASTVVPPHRDEGSQG